LRPSNSTSTCGRRCRRAVEALGDGVFHELRRLAQQVEPRGVAHAAYRRIADRQRDAAEHELRIEPVAAFLEVTAVGHLRDHVGRAEQVPEHDVARVGDRSSIWSNGFS
jgi:hypothetical protein